MTKTLLIELGINRLQYNLYDVAIRNLKEQLNNLLKSEQILFEDYKINFSKNRIVIFIKLLENTSNVSTIKEVINDVINNTIIPVKNLSLTNVLKDYIIWVQGMLDNEYFCFDNFELSLEDKEKFYFVEIENIDNYRESLKKFNVVFENESRKNFFINAASRLAKENGVILYDSPYTIEKYINEYNLPYPVIKNIDNKYLSYPKELLISTMLDICNVIPVVNDKNILMPYFVNKKKKNDKENNDIIEKMYLEKLSKMIYTLEKYNEAMDYDYEYYLDKMKSTTLSKKIGNLYEETIRLKELTKILGSYLNVGDNTLVNLNIESEICKIDLVTDIVSEMPELKGIIGYLYAKDKNFNDIISSAMYMYYKPRFYYDEMPSTTSSKILSIADKLDNIVNSFIYNKLNNIDNVFQTSEIRRDASGLINIILDNRWKLNIDTIVGDLIYIYIKNNDLVIDYDLLKTEIINFIIGRYREELINKGFEYGDIDFAIRENSYNICDSYKKLKQKE